MSKVCEAEGHEVVVSKRISIDDKHGYDPYDHAPKENSATYTDSLLIYMKTTLGTGILAMPRSFRNAGYVVGLIGTLIVGVVTTHTIHMVMSSEYELCKRKRVPGMSYPEIVGAAFEYGPKRVRKYENIGWLMCHIMILSNLMGACCIYIIFVADNVKEVIDVLYQPTDNRVIIACLLLPLILISLTKNLKVLSTLASIGNVFTMICYGIVFYYIFSGTPRISERKAVGTVKGISLAFGSVLFAIVSISVVMPLKNGMARPRQFASKFGVLNMSMVPIVALFTVIGLFGYLQFGEETRPSITLNMPQDNLTGAAVKLLLSATVYVSFGVLNYFAIDLLWPLLPEKITQGPKKVFYEYFVKVTSVLIIFVLSIVIPNLELFIALLGSLSVANLGIILPVIIETLTFWDQLKGLRFYMFLIKNICLISMALLGCAIGIVSSSTEIYHQVIIPLYFS